MKVVLLIPQGNQGQVVITLRVPQIDVQQLAEIDRFDLPDAIVVRRVVNAAKTLAKSTTSSASWVASQNS